MGFVSLASGARVEADPGPALEPLLVHVLDDPQPIVVETGGDQDSATSYARLENAFDRIDPYDPSVGLPGYEWDQP